MADQVEPGGWVSTGTEPGAFAVAGDQAMIAAQAPGGVASHATFHGRRVSWVAVSMIMAAFLIGGLALVFGPVWWLFWVAVGLTAAGGLLALATNIFDDWY